MEEFENFKIGDTVLADNNPYHEHSKDMPWAKGKLVRIEMDASGGYCFYLEGAYTYFWRIIPFNENEWYLETKNGEYDDYIYNL